MNRTTFLKAGIALLAGVVALGCSDAPTTPEAGLEPQLGQPAGKGKPGGGGKPSDLPVKFTLLSGAVTSDGGGEYQDGVDRVTAEVRASWGDGGALYVKTDAAKGKSAEREVCFSLPEPEVGSLNPDPDAAAARALFETELAGLGGCVRVLLHTRNPSVAGGLLGLTDGQDMLAGGKIVLFEIDGVAKNWDWRLVYDEQVGGGQTGDGFSVTRVDADSWTITTDAGARPDVADLIYAPLGLVPLASYRIPFSAAIDGL